MRNISAHVDSHEAGAEVSKMKSLPVLALTGLSMLGACNNGDRDVTGGILASSDTTAPLFSGLQSIATAGGASVLLQWQAAVDESSATGDIRYQVFAAATSGGHDFQVPLLTTAAGATSVILTASNGVTVGARAHYVVRALDQSNNASVNEVELAVTPVLAEAVAFVSDTATGAGTRGDSDDPFPTIQAAVDAIEAYGGGVVLVDAASGGTVYAAEVDVTATVTEIGLYGGFARFSELPAIPEGRDVLATRDVDAHTSTISNAGLASLVDDDLVRIDGVGGLFCVDGFEFAGSLISPPLTGQVDLDQSNYSSIVGVNTLFTSEVSAGDLLVCSAGGIDVAILQVSSITSDTALYASNSAAYWPSGLFDIAKWADQPAVRAVSANVQVSGCRYTGSAWVALDAGVAAEPAARIVGNSINGLGLLAVRAGGVFSELRLQNNHLSERLLALTTIGASPPSLNVPPSGFELCISNNLMSGRPTSGFTSITPCTNSSGSTFNNTRTTGWSDVLFAPADPLSGGELSVQISDNEVRAVQSGEAFEFGGLARLGAGGSYDVKVEDNFSVNTARGFVRMHLDQADGCYDDPIEVPYEDVDGSIAIRRNDFTMSNGEMVTVRDMIVAADSRVAIDCSDNFYAVAESEALEIRGESTDVAGACDRGVLDIDFRRNVDFGGTEALEVYNINVAHGGMTSIDACANTIVGAHKGGFEITYNGYFSPAAQSHAGLDGLISVNVFNNYLNGEEGVEIREYSYEIPEAFTGMLLAYVGHNTLRGIVDGYSLLRLDVDDEGRPYVGMLAERNFIGGGTYSDYYGTIDLTEVGPAVIGDLRVLNNVTAFGGGGAVALARTGPAPQLINSTFAYSGQAGIAGIGLGGRSAMDEKGGIQAYVLNCISSHNGGGDVDAAAGIRTLYSLIRDTSSPSGLGNLGGEPFYLNGIESLPGSAALSSNELLTEFLMTRETSRAVNAGNPDPFWNDANGTRNDMGAFGGPNAGPVGAKLDGMTAPFVYVATSPGPQLYTGASLVSQSEVLRFFFTRPVDPATLAAGIVIQDASGVSVPGTFGTEYDGLVATFSPSTTLVPNGGSSVEVCFTQSLADTSGQALGYAWREQIGVRPAVAGAEVEPNDDGVAGLSSADFTSAQVISAASVDSQAFELSASIAATADVDVFAVTVDAGDRLQATILDARTAGGGLDGEISLDLHSLSGRLTEGRRGMFAPVNYDPGSGDRPPGDAFLDHTFASAGTYYLVVTNASSVSAPQTYQLMGTIER